MALLDINNLSIGYNKSLFDTLNLSAHKREVIALIGNNGVGKSTFLKTLAGIIPALTGSIRVKNRDLSEYSKTEKSKIIGFSSTQHLSVPNMTVNNLVSLGRIPHSSLLGKLSTTDKSEIDMAITKTGLSDLRDKQIAKISDGEKQRAYIARLLAQQTDILLLDEPTAFLDVSGKHTIISVFRQIVEDSDKTIIFSTHDLKIAIKNSDKIWLFDQNNIKEGSPEDFIINGTFSKYFSSSNLIFEPQTADFELVHSLRGAVDIQASDTKSIEFIWTKNAFLKIGYCVDNKSDTKVVIVSNGWDLIIENSKNHFKTLYKLLKFIQNVTKN